MKRTASLLFLFFFYSTKLFCQEIPIGYMENISLMNLKKHLYTLASEEMEGRKTGTWGQRKAEEYITARFRETGLIPPPGLSSFIQNFNFHTDTYIPFSFQIGKKEFEYGKDYLPVEDQNEKEGGFKATQIVFVGYGISDKNYDDYKGKNVSGKIVVLFPGEPKANGQFLISSKEAYSHWGKSISEKTTLAKMKGAKAVLVINPSSNIMIASRASQLKMDSVLTKPALPVIRILPEMLESFFDQNETKIIQDIHREEGTFDTVHINKKIKIQLKYKLLEVSQISSNIIGMIEGSDKKEEYLVLSAHYDHLGKEGKEINYGADDNASGISALLEMARVFMQAKKDGNGPRRNIVFIAFSGEEQGLWGSAFFTTQQPVISLPNTTAGLNIDMIGRRSSNRKNDYLYIVGDDQLSSELKPISTLINEKYSKLELDYRYNHPRDPEMLFYRSDHYNFARKGVPVIFFTNGIHPDYHKPGDTPEKIDLELMQKRIQFIFLNAWEMAYRENMLRRDIPLQKRND